MKNLLSHRRSGYIRYSVLTYNIQHYEVVHEIIEKDPEAEYLLITSVFMVWDRFYLGRIHIILSKIREEVRIFLRNI